MNLTFRFSSDEEADFTLDITIGSDKTFDDLHQAIQKALGYNNQQPASFFVSNEAWEKLDEITSIDMGAGGVHLMDETKIEEFFGEKDQRILYVFDYFSERLIYGFINAVKNTKSVAAKVDKLDGHIPPLEAGIDDDINNLFGDDEGIDDEDLDDYLNGNFDDEEGDEFGGDFGDEFGNPYDNEF